MAQPRANRRSQDEWFQLIQECRSSGLSDRTWCEQHGILVSSFYNAVKRLRKSACVIPLSSNRRTYALDLTSAGQQEAVRIDICADPYPEAVPPAKLMCPAPHLDNSAVSPNGIPLQNQNCSIQILHTNTQQINCILSNFLPCFFATNRATYPFRFFHNLFISFTSLYHPVKPQLN